MAEYRVDPDVRIADLAKRSYTGTAGPLVLFAIAALELGPEIGWVHGVAWLAFVAMMLVSFALDQVRSPANSSFYP